MSEDFLYFLWQFQYFDAAHLTTTAGESLQVLAIGQRNANAGPDFINGRVIVENIEWAGSIEMHLRSSDWHRHAHTTDRAYESVVLHVVWENDADICRHDGTVVPTLALKDITSPKLLHKYHLLIESKETIPCENQLDVVSSLQKRMMLDRAATQRLERKAQGVLELLTQNHQDWEETTYQLLAQNFGFKVNAEPMLRLAQGLPLKILHKHRDNLFQLEALLFGQSGLLTPADEYALSLQKEYTFLAAKYSLKSTQLQAHEWKFLRLRPANFPTVRLAQLAAFIQQQPSLFSLFIHGENVKKLEAVLRVKQSDYWQTHYHFQKTMAAKVATLGKASVENIVVNTVVPLLAAYAEAKDNLDFMSKATELLEQLPAETNHLTDRWHQMGVESKTAFDSQAIIELYTHFCVKKGCLQCAIGTSLLKSP
ncbi:DUF2851 family protein [Runella sp. SP2]|uniref:DUF2851 family protein n=1 Tax=Runella sp. SP2 TaxID=2268026 RepID=UPI000F07C7BB|nr:DUF2851 family protein [Runella sp. SP2]AYQ35193.1 DUF2851 family protein [Runella sp. SP2]